MNEVNELQGESVTMEPLRVVREKSFENYLTSEKAKDILKHEIFNTYFEQIDRIEEDGTVIRKPYFTQYIQIPFKYNETNWEEKKEAALKELAIIFEKSVVAELVSIGCLMGSAATLKVGDNTAIAFVWPASEYNWTPKEFNVKLEVKAFRSEGELSQSEELENLKVD